LIAIGVGILLRREFFRKCFVVYGIFTIATVYWKHPLITFQKIYFSMAQDGTLAPYLIKHLPFLAIMSTIINYIKDIAFCGFFIYFLSKPKVKRRFNLSSG
jgi:hypothetical protein